MDFDEDYETNRQETEELESCREDEEYWSEYYRKLLAILALSCLLGSAVCCADEAKSGSGKNIRQECLKKIQ